MTILDDIVSQALDQNGGENAVLARRVFLTLFENFRPREMPSTILSQSGEVVDLNQLSDVELLEMTKVLLDKQCSCAIPVLVPDGL